MVLGEKGQGVFLDEKHWAKLLDMVPDEDLRAQLNKRWSSPSCRSSPHDKWAELVDAVEALVRKNKPNNKRNQQNSDQVKRSVGELRTCVQEIVLAYLYPRLDANVSKQRNHLLKSPFAVHPKTGRVCVPVSSDTMESFDPFKVPTLGQLQEELNKDSKKTSMQQYVELFESQMLKPLEAAERRKQRDIKESDAALNGDW